MTPAPPPASKDDAADVRNVLNEPVADEGFDPDTVDADFEQELEDLFADDLEDAPVVDESGGPILLDDQVEAAKPAPEAADAPLDAEEDLLVLDEVVEEAASAEDEDDDLLILDDLAEAPAEDLAEEPAEEDDLIVLDEVIEQADAAQGAEDAAEVEALVADIAEENPAEDSEDEDILDLDDLIGEEAAPAESAPAKDEDKPLIDLDDMIDEEVQLAEPEEEISLAAESPDLDADLDVDLDADLLAAVMDDEAMPEIPVDEAVEAEALDEIMDEPEGPMVVQGNVFAPTSREEPDEEPGEEPTDAELTGLEALEDDDIDDVDSLLDNVEVDVSGVEDGEDPDAALDDDLVMDLDEGSLDEVLAAESMPPDAGMDVDADVDLLLAETREEGEPSLEDLQAKVRQLESRVEDLEHRLREEIAQLVPAEAAKIIREEIAALAADFEE